MRAEAVPQTTSPDHDPGCQCRSCGGGPDVRPIEPSDGQREAGRYCRPCRKDYWGVSS